MRAGSATALRVVASCSASSEDSSACEIGGQHGITRKDSFMLTELKHVETELARILEPGWHELMPPPKQQCGVPPAVWVAANILTAIDCCARLNIDRNRYVGRLKEHEHGPGKPRGAHDRGIGARISRSLFDRDHSPVRDGVSPADRPASHP